MLEALELAILDKDVDQIVRALSSASEEDRVAAQRPLKAFWLALGLEPYVVRHSYPDLKEEHPEVRKKRAQYRLTPMDRASRKYDYDISNAAWLAWYGVADRAECLAYACVPVFEVESAQIMADRRPPWIAEWIETMLPEALDSQSPTITSSFWVLLYDRGLLSGYEHSFLKDRFPKFGLPYAFSKRPEATQKLLREVPEIIELVYAVPQDELQLSMPKDWTPVLDWLQQEGLLDGHRLTHAALDALARPLNQTERNGCIILAKFALGKPSAKNRKVSLAFQPQWISLLADAQAAIAGFALEQLAQVEKGGKLNGAETVLELPHVFNHKPKGHARKAVAMLGRLARSADLRADAVRGLAFALAHPAKEVQEDAIEQLALQLDYSDEDALESIRLHLDTVAPTLRARLETLLPGRNETEPEEPEASSDTDVGEFAARVESVAPDTAEFFALQQAVTALHSGQLAEPTCWWMNQIRVLNTYEEVAPFETVDDLVQATSAAIETCECPDTLEQVLGGIVRLHQERPKHFAALTKSLRNRACQPIMSRPLQGIVGGYVGESMTRVISVWLKEKTVVKELMEPNGFPPAEFLWEVSKRLQEGTIYPLLSIPTHRGGWIDPRVWVQRLHAAEEGDVELMERDLVRSLLRLAPDRRDEAWQVVANGTCRLSPTLQKLVQVAIEPVDSLNDFHLDDSWSVYVWVAAIRARDPWIDLADHLSQEEIAQVPEELWRLPDVFKPSRYDWKALEAMRGVSRHVRLIESNPVLPEDRDPLENEVEKLKQALNGQPLNPENIQTLLTLGETEKKLDRHMGFLTAQLNDLKVSFAPAFLYPYLATLWPMKLDWYWARSTLCLVDRIESGSSVEERYAQFLLPLFEPDRDVSRMAARALWIATASKDGNAKTMAVDVWIELTSSDRCETEELGAAWNEVFAGGWMKLNRVAEVFTEVAADGPLSAWITARLFANFLQTRSTLPRDAARLLEILDECHERLGLAVADPLREFLSTIKSGKAKPLAKSLLDRQERVTAERTAALQQALEARLARSERNQSKEVTSEAVGA